MRPRVSWNAGKSKIAENRLNFFACKRRKQLVILQSTGGMRGYRHREPKYIFGDTYVRTVLESPYAKHITLTKASANIWII